MKPKQHPANHPISSGLAALGFGLAMLAAAPLAQATEINAALSVSDDGKPGRSQELARLKEIGLPAYPGAIARSDDRNDKSGVSLGLSFGPFGFKLQVSKYGITDGIDSISNYYREALSQYGPVLDCSVGSPAALASKNEKKAKEPKDDRLGCNEISASVSERVYKVGSSKNFRLVSLKQEGPEVHFQLVRLELRGM
ncbi:hypothetical protein [Roseateles oligotrophus]|uniref:Uncharacterized protein n=1 Tax=Roseateles oligotrophus TaxID=1769250 RepID=A0ABT2YMC1_9BURK|nr:hypothetical protein [Roseateles oligotrophus]MCV2371071.1 hypothetical protein [Roseateles oligotrophus]